MHDFYGYIWIVLSHSIAWVGGVVGVALEVIRIKWKWGLQGKWYWRMWLVLIFIASYQVAREEHRNTDAVAREKANLTGDFNSCIADYRVKSRALDDAEGLNGEMLEQDRNTIDAQQRSITSQSVQIGTCLINEARMNPIVSTKFRTLLVPIFDETARSFPPGYRYTYLVLLETNRVAQPFGQFKCDDSFDAITAPNLSPTPGDHSWEVGGEPPLRQSGKEVSIHVQSNVRWADENPIHFFLRSKQRYPNCQFTPEND